MQVSVEVTEWVNDQHFVKESQLSNLNYASNEYVTEVMGNLRAEVYTRNQVDTIAADLSSELSATLKQWVLDQGYSTEGGGSSDTPTEWTNYYTKSETDNRIATAVTNGTKNFYTKSEISYIMPKKLSDLTDDLLVQYVKKSDQVKIVRCSQSEYDASTKDNNTIYVIE